MEALQPPPVHMPPPSVRVLKKLSEEQRIRIIDILTSAFWDNPVTLAYLAGDRSLMRPCMTACVNVAAECGEIHVVGDSEHRIDGVALWYPPGAEFTPSKKSGWFELIARVPQDVAEWWGPLFKSQEDFIDALLGAHAHKRAWHLFYMGVDPAVQRRGLGSQLLQHVLPKATKNKVHVILETAGATVRFYEHNGLVNRGFVHEQSPRGPEWDQVFMVQAAPE